MSDVTQGLSGLSREERALLYQRLRQKKAQDRPAAGGIHPRRGTEPPPLSFAQQRFWFLDQLRPGDASSNIASAYRISGRLDAGALHKALQAAVDRHESLRTTFRLAGDVPVQVIASRLEIALPVIDLTALPHAPEGGEPEVERLWLAESRWSFDLATGPLLRAHLLHLGPDDHVLLLVMHHIVSDGWSMSVLVREATQLYQAFPQAPSAGAAPGLPALPIQYADFAVWQREWLAGARVEEHLAYWRRQLAGLAEELDLPSDRPRPPQRSSNGSTVEARVGLEATDRLKALARSQSTTLFVSVMAAFQALLHRWSGQVDIPVGTPIAGRSQPETLGLVGFFVNTLVLRGDFSGDPSGRELVEQLGRAALDAYAHQDLPFERVVEELRPERDPSRTPLFQVMLAFQNVLESSIGHGELILRTLDLPRKMAQFDLTLHLKEEQGLIGLLEHSTDLYEASTAGRMAACLRVLAEALAADPERPVSELPLLTGAEMEQILGWSLAPAAAGDEALFHERVEARAVETPDAVAIDAGEERITYRELVDRASALAGWLQRAGVGPEEVVGLCADRSPDLVTGLLGILGAGGAFLPLDPSYPRDRLAWMLDDSGARVLLTQERLLPELPGFSGEVFLLDWPGGGAPLPLGAGGGGRVGEGSGVGALLARAAAALFLAGLAVAPALLLAREYLPQSQRAHVVGAVFSSQSPGEVWDSVVRPESLEPWRRRSVDRLLPVAAPRAFGDYTHYWGGVNYIEDAGGFAGTAAALLALAALLPWGARRRFPQERLAAGLLLAALALQAQPPGFANLFSRLPVIGLTATHQHHRALLLVCLGLAWLAACEVERWQRGEAGRPRVLLAAALLAALVVGTYLTHPSPRGETRWADLWVQIAALVLAAALLLLRPVPRWASWALAAVVAGELLWMHLPSNPPMPARLAFPTPPPVGFLQKVAGPSRIFGLGNAFLANIPAIYGLRDVRIDNPSLPAAFADLVEPVSRNPLTPRFNRPGHPLYDLLGARWLLARPGTQLRFRLAFQHPAGWIYERPHPLPLLFLPARARMHRGGPWTTWVHRNTDFAARTLVLPSPGYHRHWRARRPAASTVALTSLEPARIRARASLAEPRLLATGLFQDGNWQLLVNGERTPTTLSNGPLLAGWLPEGAHEIELLYRPRAFVAGCVLAALALAAAALWWVPRPRFPLSCS